MRKTQNIPAIALGGKFPRGKDQMPGGYCFVWGEIKGIFPRAISTVGMLYSYTTPKYAIIGGDMNPHGIYLGHLLLLFECLLIRNSSFVFFAP